MWVFVESEGCSVNVSNFEYMDVKYSDTKKIYEVCGYRDFGNHITYIIGFNTKRQADNFLREIMSALIEGKKVFTVD